MVDHKLDSYERDRLWQHFLHEDTFFSEHLNSFLLFQTILLAAAAALLAAKLPNVRNVIFTFGTAGILLSVLWGYLQFKQWHMIKFLVKRCCYHFPEFEETWATLNNIWWRRLPTSGLIAILAPALIIATWVALIIFAQD